MAAAHGGGNSTDTAVPRVKNGYGHAKQKAVQMLINDTPEEKLRETLSVLADSYPDLNDFLQKLLDPPTLDTEKAILAAVKQSLQPVRRARSWHRQTKAALQAYEEISLAAKSTSASKEAAMGLLAAAYYTYRQSIGIDDSDGALQEACADLSIGAIKIVNSHPEWMSVIDNAVNSENEFPLVRYVLEYGNARVSEHMVSRLEKHLYKTDSGFPKLLVDNAHYILFDHFSSSGDPRFLDLLSEHKLHPHIELSMRAAYYEKRLEWSKLVDLLWPERGEYACRKTLKKALGELKDSDRLIQLYIEGVLSDYNISHSLAVLKHLLGQYGRLDELPSIIDKIAARKDLELEQYLDLMVNLGRYDEAVQTMLNELDPNEQPRGVSPFYANSPYGQIGTIVAYLEKIPKEFTKSANKVWRALLEQESERIGRTNRYNRFESFGDILLRSGEQGFVQEVAEKMIQDYPTRKKLVEICQGWL